MIAVIIVCRKASLSGGFARVPAQGAIRPCCQSSALYFADKQEAVPETVDSQACSNRDYTTKYPAHCGGIDVSLSDRRMPYEKAARVL